MLLRIVLRVVIAIGLILQGGMGASAAQAGSGHHCTMSSHHDGQAPKCPCCPAKSLLDCTDACMTIAALSEAASAFTVTPAPAPAPIERPRFVESSIDTPLRPPIA